MIPALVKSLDQDVKARSLTMESISSVRELAIAIKQGAELVKLSKGSANAVAAAQSTISSALSDLDGKILQAESLKNSAIKEFAGNIKKLLEVMGSETAQYVKQKAEIGDLLRIEYENEQKLHAELAHKKGMKFIEQGEMSEYPYTSY